MSAPHEYTQLHQEGLRHIGAAYVLERSIHNPRRASRKRSEMVEAFHRFSQSCLMGFEAFIKAERQIEFSARRMSHEEYLEIRGELDEFAAANLSLAESALSDATLMNVKSDTVRKLRDLVDDWAIPIRDPDAFFDADSFREFAEDAQRLIDSGDVVDGGFGG
ncbi:MAG: hypothetical protein O3A46_10045 [Candidatus Poribacteria bacterium]|nr:hypothetical protein [Candidatus Poribacteria bacterium]